MLGFQQSLTLSRPCRRPKYIEPNVYSQFGQRLTSTIGLPPRKTSIDNREVRLFTPVHGKHRSSILTLYEDLTKLLAGSIFVVRKMLNLDLELAPQSR